MQEIRGNAEDIFGSIAFPYYDAKFPEPKGYMEQHIQRIKEKLTISSGWLDPFRRAVLSIYFVKAHEKEPVPRKGYVDFALEFAKQLVLTKSPRGDNPDQGIYKEEFERILAILDDLRKSLPSIPKGTSKSGLLDVFDKLVNPEGNPLNMLDFD